MATSTSRLDESDLLNKHSQHFDTRIQGGLSQSLSRLEDRLKTTIEGLHETIAWSVGTRSHHSGEMHGEYGCSNSQSAPVDRATDAAALSCHPNQDFPPVCIPVRVQTYFLEILAIPSKGGQLTHYESKRRIKMKRKIKQKMLLLEKKSTHRSFAKIK